MASLKNAAQAALTALQTGVSAIKEKNEAAARSAAILVQAEEALSVLNKLQNTSEKCREDAAKANALRSVLEKVWQGDSGNALAQSLTNWAKQQSAIADELDGQITSMRRAINDFVEADRALARQMAGK